ncbi:MAG: hypothetical protein ABR573_03020 [Candidatus Dormibacteria bacterium]
MSRTTSLLLLLLAAGMMAASPAPTPTPPAVAPGASATPSAGSAPAKHCAHLDAPVPKTLADFALSEESVCGSLSQTQRVPAVSALTLYSVRRADQLLIATLEVGRLKPAFDPSSSAVRGTITAQVGDTSPERLKVGNTIVYVSQARGLSVLTWFRKRDFYVLAVRDIFDRPRTMLREALAASQ